MKINLVEYFENTADSFPDKLALVDDSSTLSFKEFRNRAKSVATHISKNNKNAINRPIAIYLPKSNNAVIALVGTLYSGNCYAPLDTKSPIARIKAILANLDASCIVTNNDYINTINDCDLNIDVINIDEIDFDDNEKDKLNFEKCIDTDPAYVLHTSGSTGVPKGVVISHRSVIDYISWVVNAFNITEKEIIGNQTPFIFDMSTLDIYLMVFKGATLNLIPEKKFIFPATLLEYINEHKINLIFWVPAVLVNVANLKLFDSVKVPFVKKVLFGGEVMPPKHLNYWIEGLNKGVVYGNLYGPTEITGTCTCHILTEPIADGETVPIGKPCRNTAILLLNENDELCEIGEKGELCVRGSSLAMGYWNNPEKTNTLFVQNPLQNEYPEKIYRTGDIVYYDEVGNLIYVGRRDFQIKLSGYRIDLGEIEHTILSTFGTINAGVFFDRSKEEIVLVYESENEISTEGFRTELSKVLSKHMIPRRYIKIDSLPKTTSGKIDRSYLNENINTYN